MRIPSFRRAGWPAWVALAAAALAPSLLAQQPQPSQDPLAALKTKDNLGDDDKKKVRERLEQHISTIAANDMAGTALALNELRSGISGASAGYKEFYVTTYSELARNTIPKVDVPAATRLLAILGSFKEASAYPVFIENLKSDKSGVRTAAAIGLRDLRSKLAVTGTQYFAEVMHALRDAGQKETSPVTLKEIYQAMNYAEAGVSPPDPKVNAQSLLELLESRATQYDANAVKAECADTPGLQAAGALRQSMTDDERNRFTAIVGRMLRYAVQRYVSGDPPLALVRDKSSSRQLIDLRNNTEQLIDEAEKQLTALLAPPNPPSVLKEMKKAGEKAVPEMKIQLQEWSKILKGKINLELNLTETPDSEEGDGG